MLSQAMQDAFNKQVNEELFSAYMYASIANYFEHKNLKGFAHWMNIQAKEELAHAHKFIDYINDRGGRITLSAIDAPKNDWDSVLTAVQEALEHERHVTESINKLSTMSMECSDHASHTFLEWFVAEQVEEESTASDLVEQVKMIEGAPAALFMLDRELSTRSVGQDPAV